MVAQGRLRISPGSLLRSPLSIVALTSGLEGDQSLLKSGKSGDAKDVGAVCGRRWCWLGLPVD